MKRIIIAAGGTGGHFYPGLVLAQNLKTRGWEPLVVVRTSESAKKILEKNGIAAVPMDLEGMPRK